MYKDFGGCGAQANTPTEKSPSDLEDLGGWLNLDL